jgi:hypothetical protein
MNANHVVVIIYTEQDSTPLAVGEGTNRFHHFGSRVVINRNLALEFDDVTLTPRQVPIDPIPRGKLYLNAHLGGTTPWPSQKPAI